VNRRWRGAKLASRIGKTILFRLSTVHEFSEVIMLTGKSAIVTGGASGFGAEIARVFAGAGAKVLVADMNEAGAAEVAAALRGKGGHAASLRVNVTSKSDVEKMVAMAVKEFGGLDILVNNAGTLGPRGTLEQTSEAEFDAMFAVNVKGAYLGAVAALPHFGRQRRGVIINIASGSALRPRAGAVAYSASKGAVVTMTRALALEVAEHGVRVNAICPAIAKTPMARLFVGEAEDSEVWDRLGQDLPLGRLVTPADVAAAALWLASDAAAMVTGTCLAVDGGRCA
jgi:3-oxoacyl-[acyl-carrier protein] reductase